MNKSNKCSISFTTTRITALLVGVILYVLYVSIYTIYLLSWCNLPGSFYVGLCAYYCTLGSGCKSGMDKQCMGLSGCDRRAPGGRAHSPWCSDACRRKPAEIPEIKNRSSFTWTRFYTLLFILKTMVDCAEVVPRLAMCFGSLYSINIIVTPQKFEITSAEWNVEKIHL